MGGFHTSWAVIVTLIAEQFPYRLVVIPLVWLLWLVQMLKSGFHMIAMINERFFLVIAVIVATIWKTAL